MLSACTVLPTVGLCESLKWTLMASPVWKTASLYIVVKTLFLKSLSPVAMWMFLFLYSVYFTVISAHDFCPDACECRGKNIKCAGRNLLQIPTSIPKDVTNLWVLEYFGYFVVRIYPCICPILPWYINL
jgi:hypothetical protein